MPCLSIHVEDNEGNSLEGKKVFVHYNIGTHEEGFTDGNGDVDFDAPDYCEADVTVDGETVNVTIHSEDRDATVSL